MLCIFIIGNCAAANDTGDNSNPQSKTPEKYYTVPLDGTFEHPGYCDYIGQSGVNCGGGTEWAYAGDGSACKCRALCNDGCRKKLCKRIGFNGDPVQCCVQQLGGLGEGKTCNPIFINGYKTPDCNTYMDAYCGEGTDGSNFFTPQCQSWFASQRIVGSNTLLKV